VTLLGIDAGTTHCKAGLFRLDGAAIQIASRVMPARRQPDGRSIYDPAELWETVASVVSEVTAGSGSPVAVAGIASMAETGLLLDRRTGEPRTPFVPWYDTAAAPQAAQLRQADDPRRRFSRTGIFPGYKNSLAKILWLREQQPDITRDACWLSVADYIAYRLTGVAGTDYSLAGRSYAFSLPDAGWDEAWLQSFGLSTDLFPPANPSGTPLGRVTAPLPALPAGTPVAVSGHDHLCAAVAAGVVEPGCLFDSMGTAEVLMGVIPPRRLGEAEYASNLTFGYHTAPGRFYWLGGLSASGGSLDWLRGILGDPPLKYTKLEELAAAMPPEPGEILYLPYLAGSSSPWPDLDLAGAFLGLRAGHGRPALLKAVLEGAAYQIEAMRRAACDALGSSGEQIVVAGGGARIQHWLQIKADVTGCRHEVTAVPEAAALGAALVAATGSNLYASIEEAVTATARPPLQIVEPDAERHAHYRRLYEQFVAWQEPLRRLSRAGGSDG